MKMKMRPRYYCDHCSKVSGSPSAMRVHEASCTANPHRICRFCGDTTPVAHRASVLTFECSANVSWRDRMDALRGLTNNCPGCILAAIRQSKVQQAEFWPEDMLWRSEFTGGYCVLGFNFKAEKEAYLKERNRARAASADY